VEGMTQPVVSLGALWLPVLLAAVLSFAGSAIVWTAFHWHDADWKLIPDEGAFLEALRKAGLATGQYMFPHMDPKAADKKAQQRVWEERYAQGPVGVLFFGKPGRMNMGKTMGQMVLCLHREPCPAARRRVPRGVPGRRRDGVRGLRLGAVRGQHLVLPLVAQYVAQRARRADLRLPDGGDVRLALAAVAPAAEADG